MEKQIIVRERQRFLSSDMTDMQGGLRETFDELIRQAVGPGNYYSGFGATGSLFELTLQPGRIYMAGAMYRRTTTTVFAQELFNARPLAQKRIVAVVAWGQDIETTESGAPTEPRQFVVNTTTRETQVQQVSTRSIRSVQLDLVAGVEAAQPVAPAIGANAILIATVLLNNAGIEAVAMNPAAVLPQSERNAVALAVLQDFLEAQVLRINTLVSDQAAIRAAMEQLATKTSVAAVRVLAETALERANAAYAIASNLDTGAGSEFLRDFEDHYADTRLTDVLVAGYAAVVDFGLGFPAGSSATLTNGVELFNPIEPKVKVDNDLILPAFAHRLRIDTFGQGKVARQAALQSYTSGTHQVRTTVPPTKKTVYETRQVTAVFYLPLAGNPTKLFGITFDFGNDTGLATNEIPLTKQTTDWALANMSAVYRDGTMFPDLTITKIKAKVATDDGGSSTPPYKYKLTVNVTFTYTKKLVESSGGQDYVQDVVTTAEGQGRGETWLQERDGWLTQVGLFFTSKGPSGDVKLLITETDDAGSPALDRAPVVRTIPYADIKTAPMATASPDGIETLVTIPPVLLSGGRRYAVDLISNGNHFVRMTEGVGSITQGEHWALSDANKWVRPQLETPQTMAMRLYFAQFASTKVEVDLKPLALPGGIHDVAVQAQMVVPSLTALAFEVQPDGANWRVLGPTSGQRIAADLTGNPELMPFRVVFEGTQDIMPALSRGSAKSIVKVSKPALAFTHFSTVVDVGAGNTANMVKVINVLRGYKEDEHDFTVTLICDPRGAATVETADAVTDVELPNGAISRTSVFNLAAGQRTFRVKSVGASSGNAKDLYRVESIYAAFFDT